MQSKLKRLANNLGYSMVEAIAVLGVSSIAILGLVEVSHQMARSTRSMQVNSEVQNLFDDIETVVRNPDTCSASMVGSPMAVDNALTLVDPANPLTTFLTSNKCYPSNAACDFKVTDVKVTETTGAINPRGLRRANFRVTAQKQGAVFGGSTIAPRDFTVFYYESAGALTGCTGSTSMADVCKGLCGGDNCWDNSKSQCNILNFTPAQCSELGGTYDTTTGYCEINPMYGQVQCEALFGKSPSRWISGQCVLNAPTGAITGYQDGCNQMRGAWCDPTAPGSKCSSLSAPACILYNMIDSCTSFGGVVKPDSVGVPQCTFIQDNQKLCREMGGDWNDARTVKCLLPVDGVKICNDLGGSWTGTLCKLYDGTPLPPSIPNPTPAIFPVPSVIPSPPIVSPDATPLPTPSPILPPPGPKYYWSFDSWEAFDVSCAVGAVNAVNCTNNPPGVICSSPGTKYTCTQEVRFYVSPSNEPTAIHSCTGVICQ